jgi:hypothetical protein
MIDLSNPYILLGIILLVAVLVLGIVYLAVPYSIKKGYPIEEYLTLADKNLDTIQNAVNTVSKVVPVPYIELIEKVFNLADVAIHNAEQLYKIGELQKDERKNEARDYVNNALKLVGVEVTPELQKVIDGAIQASVSLLPKTHDENLGIQEQTVTSEQNTMK